ncbi:MAG: hypothetical protein M5R40_17160 [Anaerolineae bacterium]|nr:hypothetical protein [Anaerolineae bacterium]
MSSSPDHTGVSALIDESLTILRRECPRAYGLLCDLLAPREVLVQIDDEATAVNFGADAITIAPAPRHPCVRLTASRQTLLDLLDARLSLIDAVLSGDVLLQGDIDDLARFHEGLLTYLRGGVRCPSFPGLLDQLRYPPT